jgi:HemY protein
LIKVARKLNAMNSDACHRIELEAIVGQLANLNMSLPEVEQVSKQAGKRIRSEPSFVLSMSKALWSRGAAHAAQEIVENYLKSAWDDALVKHYVQISENHNLLALEKVEGWLVKQPHNPTLLMALGVMCRDRELWGKSESYLRASDALDASAEVAYELSELYKIMNRLQESRVQLELFAVRQVEKF